VRRPWGTYSLAYFDDGASVCGCDAAGKPLYPGMGLGTGTATGTTLNATIRFWCLSRPRTYYGTASYVLVYDAAADQLTDQYGIVWRRGR